MTSVDADGGTTVDRFLGGRLAIEQPARGRHRAGLDAILLAAAVPADAVGRLIDFGAGVGTAGLAVATRVAGVAVILAERDAEALDLAARNRARCAAEIAGRVTLAAVDLIVGAAREAALGREAADWVIANPPYFTPHEVRASPSAARAAAHVLTAGGLEAWIRAAAATLAPGGRLALIFKGDGLAEILAACAGRFGEVAIRPIHPRAEAAAHRLLVTAIKGSRGPARIVPGLVLHPAAGSGYLDAADAVLRGDADLATG
ncbi:SAM-dependent methyltransferase [Siculibacillus lacustris]|uniref:SAM-dependent methyltransferase n=1 Tax=Siculibacillus lacustris TaxID=1549641 RepID=A0A4Q9VHN3_9HYPH|nr:methyltransferase [Siculibacillus lacustris]TBW34395.1 SAM-dependent methyltransferase [Siculibacillus lacustris]